MPRKSLPLHELEGLKGISYEECELAVFKVLMGEGTVEEVKAFYGGRAHFRLLHDWLLKTGNSNPAALTDADTTIKPLVISLAYALLDLANGKEPKFLTVSKRSGPDNDDRNTRYATAAAAACFASEKMHGRQQKIQRWWSSLIGKHDLQVPENLKSYISNVAGQEGNTPDKVLLLAAHAVFVQDATSAQHKARLAAIMEMAEEFVRIASHSDKT
jgi:hypothetical protein